MDIACEHRIGRYRVDTVALEGAWCLLWRLSEDNESSQDFEKEMAFDRIGRTRIFIYYAAALLFALYASSQETSLEISILICIYSLA